jgi:phosphoserine phosphatase
MEDRLTTRVILVRHGESTYNVERRVQGHCDESVLTASGEAAALQVASALQGIALNAAYSSPLKRAHRTATLILSQVANAPTLQTSLSLREINLPEWEGVLFKDIAEKYPDAFHDWQTQPHLLKMTEPEMGGEFYPVSALYDQARRFWQAVLPNHAGETILIVAHSGINRALINTAIGLPPAAYQAMNQSNCGITVLNCAGNLGDPVQIEALNLTAHLGEPVPQRKGSHQGPRLLLVRHGETDWNRQGRFQGQIDVPLNNNGRSQAAQAATFLQPIPLTGAVSSSMARPKETAEIILAHHPHLTLELRDDLREISHGLWEGKFEAEIEQEYPGLLQQWQSQPETVQMPEGENLQDIWHRAIAGWQAIVTAAAQSPTPLTILVVAHDAINKAILCHVSGLGPESFWQFKQGNGAVSVIDYSQDANSAPILQAANITVHLGGVLDKTAAGAL